MKVYALFNTQGPAENQILFRDGYPSFGDLLLLPWGYQLISIVKCSAISVLTAFLPDLAILSHGLS